MDAWGLLLAVFFFSLLGTLLGAFGGLVPGLHINNLAYLVGASAAGLAALSLSLFSFLGALAAEAPLLVGALIIAALVANTFTAVLPSVFLGAPDPGRALSVLPAHRLLLAGRGLDAVRCSLIGCVGGLAVCLAALPIFRLVMGDPVEAYAKLKPHMALILMLIVTLLILSEPLDRFGRKGCCAMLLSRVQSAALVLGANRGRPGEEVGGVPFIRPWMAQKYVGRTVCVGGLVSEANEEGGHRSFVLEEGGALVVLVPDGLREADAAVGEIVFAEGRIAPSVGWGFGARRKLLAVALFLASGFLGLLVLESGRPGALNWFPLGAPPVPEAVMMFPLFCGLFGLPTLLLGLLERPATPGQELAPRPLGLKRALRGLLSGTLAGGVMGWYPGMTAAHGSVLGKLYSGDLSDPEATFAGDHEATREFLVSVSAVTMANTFFNIVALFVIGRARSGALHIAQDVMAGSLESWSPAGAAPPAFALLAFAAAVAASLSYPLTLRLGKGMTRLYDRVPYRRLMAGIVAFLLALLFLFSGAAGLLLAGLATCLGLIPPLAGVRRVHLMGSILVPVMVYFLGISSGVMGFLGF